MKTIQEIIEHRKELLKQGIENAKKNAGRSFKRKRITKVKK